MSSSSVSVADITQWVGGRVANAEALGEKKLASLKVTRPAALADALEGDVAFFFSKDYQRELMTAQPSVLVTGEAFVKPLQAAGLPLWKTAAIVACADPYLAMALVSERFAPGLSTVSGLVARSGAAQVHPTAVVDLSVELGAGVRVGANVVIEAGCKIGAGTEIFAGCYLGPEVTLGDRCMVFAGVKIYEKTRVGSRVRLHSGVVLGADGFGYAPIRGAAGQVTGHQKIYHLGRVVIGDDTEIGANSCVDRGTFGDTVVGCNVKIDNMVQVGHNCQVGDGSIICGNAGLAGSAIVGKFVYIGGGAGIGNRIVIGDGASIGAYALISKDVEPGGQATGIPQRDPRTHFRAHALLNKMVSERRKK